MFADDRQLLLQLRKGDEQAARALWSRHAPRLTAYARAILARRDPSGAPDVVQSVFLAVLRRRPAELRAVSDPTAWLLTLTRHAALSRARLLRREQDRMLRLEGRAHRPSAAGTALAESDALHAALASLPRHFREIVVLKHAGGLSLDQIAAALGANRNTLASRYRAAMSRLRALLDGGADGSAVPLQREVLHARP